MYKCYNPILSVCLCCEFLTKIGSVKSALKTEGETLKGEILRLGEGIIGNFDPNPETHEDLIKRIFLDSDFFDRTVLKLITDNGYEELLTDDMVERLLDDLW